MPTNRAFLYEYLGDRTKMVDSAKVSVPGRIQFTLPPESHPGLYRIVVGPNNFWDFIFNKENVSLRTHYSAPFDSLKSIESFENDLWVKNMNFFITLNRKAEGIMMLMNLYEKGSGFYTELESELNKLRNLDPQRVSREIIREHPHSYVARFLKTEQNPAVPAGLNRDAELTYILDHFFDEVDFADSALIYSPPLISKVRAYFSLFQRAYPASETEERMIKGLDRLMSRAAVSDPVFNFLINSLSETYEKSEYETFFAYLTENYLLGASCTDEERSTELSEVLASIRKTKIGIQAPEIILPLEDGPVILSDIPEKYVLVVFWASWCPHCKEYMPVIKEIYSEYHMSGFEVVAISIDKTKAEYDAALKKGQYPWINYSELKGWDCSIAYDYGIRATPTMILLDENRKIISKPRNPAMLRELLIQRGLVSSR